MGTPLRIAYLVQSLEAGGLERMVADLARGARAAYDPEIVCYDGLGTLAPDLERDGIPTTLLRRRPGVDLAYPVLLARHLAERGVTLLHAHNDTALFYGTLAARAAGVPAVVYTEHDRDFPAPRRVARLNHGLALLVDAVVPVSRVLEELLRRHEGIEGAKVRVIHNGVAEAPPPDAAERARARAELGLAPDAPVAGIFAGLKPVKNHAVLLGAWPQVRARVPGATLLVVGDGELRGELERKAGEGVRFLGYRDPVRPCYAAVDVVVLPSRNEGLPLTVLEALAAARPVVASRVGGIPEAVEEGRTGLLVPPGDGPALARALGSLLGDRSLRDALGEAGRRSFEARFTRRAMIDAYLEVYAGCLRRRNLLD